MDFSKVEPRHWDCEVQELRFSCLGCEGLDKDPKPIFACNTQQVLGEHGDVLEFLDRVSEDVLLQVHFHAQMLAHLGGCVLSLSLGYRERGCQIGSSRIWNNGESSEATLFRAATLHRFGLPYDYAKLDTETLPEMCS